MGNAAFTSGSGALQKMADDSKSARNEVRDELFAAFARDRSDLNRNAVAESYFALAEFFAARYRNRGVEPEDLRQVAKMALVRAVDRFDPDLGVQFSTFAGRAIDGELKRHFRDKTWALRVPRSLQERSATVRQGSDELSLRNGRSPTIDELAQHLKLEADEVIEALDVQRSYSATSLDLSVTGEGVVTLGDQMACSAGDTTDTSDTRVVMRRLLSELPARERQILALRFFGDCSQAEIAEQVGVSQMHVSRIIRRTLEQLRVSMGSITQYR